MAKTIAVVGLSSSPLRPSHGVAAYRFTIYVMGANVAEVKAAEVV